MSKQDLESAFKTKTILIRFQKLTPDIVEEKFKMLHTKNKKIATITAKLKERCKQCLYNN